MLDVTVIFRNSSAVLKFAADDVSLETASVETVEAGEASSIGELVGYTIKIEQGAVIFLDLKEVAGFFALERKEPATYL